MAKDSDKKKKESCDEKVTKISKEAAEDIRRSKEKQLRDNEIVRK